MNTENITYTISESNKDELNELLHLCDENFTPKLSQRVNIKDYSEKIFNNAVRFEAWKNKKLIGLIAAYFNQTGLVFITNVCVLSEFSGKGVAAHLLEQCINESLSQKMTMIELEVSEENHRAIRFYEKFKFEKLEIKDGTIKMALKS